MSMDRLNADFTRIFGDYERVFADHEPSCPAQKEIESGARIRAAVKRPALIIASSATRDTETHEGEIDHV